MTVLTVFLVALFAFSLISRRLEETPLTPPIVFTAGGLLLSLLVPNLGERMINSELLLRLGEIALALLLFTDASRINPLVVLHSKSLPGRLLFIGMPLTILLGTILAKLILPQLSVWEAAILATILAPTDAGLGQVVVSNERVPLGIRQALEVESGLNDGLSMPFLMLFIGLAAAQEQLTNQSWVAFAASQVGLGFLVGLAIGWLGGGLLGKAASRKWMSPVFEQLGMLALALIAWRLAGQVGGNGFIATFVAGMAVRLGFRSAREHAVEFSEAWGALLNYSVFFLFGAFVVVVLPLATPAAIFFAVLSLTVIRMVPVGLSMISTGLRSASLLFMGWFGPRGLASVVLGLIFLEQELESVQDIAIAVVVVATVLLSIFAHGVSARPGTDMYLRSLADLPPGAPELQ